MLGFVLILVLIVSLYAQEGQNIAIEGGDQVV